MIWDLYGRFYDTYSIFAGRSSFPLIRQVDVYGFFEEARLLDRGPLERAEGRVSPPQPSSPGSPLLGTTRSESKSTTPQAAAAGHVSDEALVPKSKVVAHPLTT